MPTTLKDFLSEVAGELADNRVSNFGVEDNYDNYSFADFTTELEEILEQKQEEDEEVCEHVRFLQDYNEQRSLYDKVENLIISHLYDEGEIATCDCCSDTHTKYHIVGQCLDGKCPDSVDSLCDDCGKWDYEAGVWRCADCQDKHVKEEEEETGESFTRTCLECDDDFTPSVEHAKDAVCDECVSEKGKKQILIKSTS